LKESNNINNPVEYIEEWDWEKAVPTGRAVERKTAHREGISHEGVHLWVVRFNNGPELLFQHRASHKDMFPDCLDITVGGHVPFGKNENKVQKESYEEIGINPTEKELIDLGYFRYEEKSKDLFHREFQRVYLMTDNRPLTEYRFVDGEVDGIFAVKLSDLELLLTKDFSFQAEGYENSGIFKKNFSRKDFHPLLFSNSMKEYMDVIVQVIKEIADNKKVTVKMPSPV
jgi:isopentenyl-diphosphate Delta-isomerase